MKIKLLISGGFIPVNKEAEIDTNISEMELNELISVIEVKQDSNSKARDKKYFTLEVEGKSVLINPELVPENHKPWFSYLTKNLERVEKNK